MTETQRDLLIGYLDIINSFPHLDPRAEDLKANVLKLFDSMQDGADAGWPMQDGPFRNAYLARCRAALDNCSADSKRRLITDFSKVSYYFAAGEGLPIYLRYLRSFDVMTELLDYVKGGDSNV